jgi:hypothetical protein
MGTHPKTVAQVRSDTAKRTADAKAKLSATSGEEVRMPQISVSPAGPDGKIDVTVTGHGHRKDLHHSDCPAYQPCSHCGGEMSSITVTYRCATAEDALATVRVFTDSESYKFLLRAECLYRASEKATRELAQWVMDHPQYTAAEIASWRGNADDESYIEDLRRWAKGGFKGESPLWLGEAF